MSMVGKAVPVCGEEAFGNAALSTQFWSEPKIALKNKAQGRPGGSVG